MARIGGAALRFAAFIAAALCCRTAEAWQLEVGSAQPSSYNVSLRADAALLAGVLTGYQLQAYQRPLSAVVPAGERAEVRAACSSPCGRRPPSTPSAPRHAPSCNTRPPARARNQVPEGSQPLLDRILAHNHALSERALQRGVGGQLDTHRLEQALKRVLGGEPTKVVFLGGSITAGHDLPPGAESWAARVYAWLASLAPQPDKVGRAGGGLGRAQG